VEVLPVSDPTKEQLEAFIQRAGFTYGWERLESWARRMAEQAVVELNAQTDPLTAIARQTMAEEYEFLTWFAHKAANEKARQWLAQRYTEETGKPVPVGWRGE
jgi:hypothetical protein